MPHTGEDLGTGLHKLYVAGKPITAGTLRSLDENEFCTAVGAAAARMINDQNLKMLQLKARAFGESR
ncbi:MAG TPA: hypothetical protein VN408_33700 [Actinoplanes sp.]|nr:hypothetical protein [Actinoplanes sp.]